MANEYIPGLKKGLLLFAAVIMLSGRLGAFTPESHNVSFNPAAFPLLKTPPNLPVNQTITLTNNGNETVKIDSITNTNIAFEIAPRSFDLVSGLPQDITVTFRPAAYGIFSDSLTIYTSTGTKLIYKIKTVGVHSSQPYINLSSKSFAFGTLKTGSTAKKSLMVTNFGVVDLSVTSITLSGNAGTAFAVTPPGRTIASCDSAAFEISFSPGQAADYTANLKLNANAVNSGEIVQLSGKGATGTPPDCRVSKNSVHFGAVRAGQQRDEYFTITNTGLDNLNVSTVTSDNTIFSVDLKTFTLTSNESKTLKITFAPQSEGTFSSKLTIVHNAASSPSEISLYGSSFIYSPSITLNTNISFASVTDIRNYRIIGLPGNIDLPINQAFTGRAEFDWNAVWDNGQGTNYKVKYDGSSKFNFRPGNAFWIISKNPMKVSKTVSPVALTAVNDYSIPLNTGWNLISNPFDKDVNWADVRLANSLPANAVIYAWSGSYSQAEVFAPYQGYYFYNAAGLADLKIPYKTTTALSKGALLSGTPQLIIEAGNEWGTAAPVRLGFNKNASDGFDELDYMMPPGDFESVGLRIYNSRLTTGYKYLSCEMRPGDGEGEVFDLKVKNETGRNLTLLISGADGFAGREVSIAEKGISRFTDLKSCSEFTVQANHKYPEYSVIIGSREFLEVMKKKLVPADFAVMQNYPNPFNPSTSIKYSLPAACRVEIDILNLLGERIAQIKNAFEDAGSHEVNWNAGGISSGVYFYSVKAAIADGTELFRDVKKMVLVK